MPQNERLRVWKGELKKTSGGLRKQNLMKNKRGKIVSRKKSDAAKKNKENNLGQWLRSKGELFLSKGLKQENIERKNKAGRKAFKKKEEIPEEKQSEVPKQPPKSGTKQKKAPATITRIEPSRPGEEPDVGKVSIGNIRSGRRSRKLSKKAKENLEQELRVLGASDVQLKKLLENAGLAQANLRASKRRGKKRSRKEILQDVLDA